MRKEFGSNIDAVISVVANAVGLGNVWRFPYICYKSGGGAFFIPYTAMLVLAAMPIMGMEMAWGQFTSLGPIESWNCYPLLGGIGICGIFITWLIIIYYSVSGNTRIRKKTGDKSSDRPTDGQIHQWTDKP